MFGPEGCWQAKDAPTIFVRAAYRTTNKTAELFWETADRPGFRAEQSVKFAIVPDGNVSHLRSGPVLVGDISRHDQAATVRSRRNGTARWRRWTWSSSLPRRIRLKDTTMMDPKTVEKLEEKVEEAVAEVIVKMGLKKLPLLPSRHTIQMMAKLPSPSTKQRSRTSDERNEHEEIGHRSGPIRPGSPVMSASADPGHAKAVRPARPRRPHSHPHDGRAESAPTSSTSPRATTRRSPRPSSWPCTGRR